MRSKIITLSFLLIIFLSSCDKGSGSKFYAGYQIDYLNDQMNEAIIQDGFSPPVASRIYAYTNLGAYEAYFLRDENKRDLSRMLTQYTSFEKDNGKDYDRDMGTFVAFCEIAREKVYRDFIIDSLYARGLKYYKHQLDRGVFKNSMNIGKAIAEHVIAYSATDNYKETRSMPLWEVTRTPGTWEPTPPMYGTAVEPYYGKLRPFAVNLDSLTIPDPVPFDSTKGSEFYNLAYETYIAGIKGTEEEKRMAIDWDGDPAATERIKHIIVIKKQLNPVGHWLAIGKALNHKTKKDEGQSIETYLRVSLASADAMIVCWKKKFDYNLIRPHTYINRYIDKNWDPLLSTPPFPEYPSGHSTFSGACAEVLIDIFSDTVSFTDNSKERWGHAPRQYANISSAARECAQSRIFAGVHYRPATVEGVALGRQVGESHKQKFQNATTFMGSKGNTLK